MVEIDVEKLVHNLNATVHNIRAVCNELFESCIEFEKREWHTNILFKQLECQGNVFIFALQQTILIEKTYSSM